MRPRGCKIAIISIVLFFLNLQRIDFMFLRERMIEDFSQESENLVFYLPSDADAAKTSRAWAWPRLQNWFHVLLASCQFSNKRRNNLIHGDLMKHKCKSLYFWKSTLLSVSGDFSLGTVNRSCGFQFGLL